MIRINSNLFPKSGFIFKEADGTTIAGNTWAGVVARLRSYRKRNNLPPGDPENEVRTQACDRDPVLCNNDDGSHAAAVKIATLKGRILQWFSRIKKEALRTPFVFASGTDAANRANVCAGCPHRKPLPEGCSSCKAAVTELRVSVIGDRAPDKRLIQHGCNVLGTDLSTQAWLEEITVDHPELPGHCWRKRTI